MYGVYAYCVIDMCVCIVIVLDVDVMDCLCKRCWGVEKGILDERSIRVVNCR